MPGKLILLLIGCAMGAVAHGQRELTSFPIRVIGTRGVSFPQGAYAAVEVFMSNVSNTPQTVTVELIDESLDIDVDITVGTASGITSLIQNPTYPSLWQKYDLVFQRSASSSSKTVVIPARGMGRTGWEMAVTYRTNALPMAIEGQVPQSSNLNDGKVLPCTVNCSQTSQFRYAFRIRTKVAEDRGAISGSILIRSQGLFASDGTLMNQFPLNGGRAY